MKPIFSVLHASYGRPEKAIKVMELMLERAVRPECVEYIFAVNLDDPTHFDVVKHSVDSRPRIHPYCVFQAEGGSAPAWDMAASFSHGDILVQMQDDVDPPEGWDELLLDSLMAIAEHCDPLARPVFIQVSDGYRTDGFCFMAIMNRAYYEMQGEFLHAGYLSMFSDDDVFYRAKKNARDGKATLIDATHIVFRHEHHSHNKAVECDDTYLRENSDQAYLVGGKLFSQRNPEAFRDGLRNWGG